MMVAPLRREVGQTKGEGQKKAVRQMSWVVHLMTAARLEMKVEERQMTVERLQTKGEYRLTKVEVCQRKEMAGRSLW